MNNILVVNINWLGDAIFSTPVFKALKKNYPQAHVVCLCVPRVKEVLDLCPFVDEVIVYDEKGYHRWVWNKIALIARLRRQRFDAAFILHRSMTRALMVFLAGIPQRIGYSKSKVLLTHAVDLPVDDRHRCDGYLEVVEAYGLSVEDRSCELQLNLKDMQSLDQKLSAAGIGEAEDFIVLNTGGNWDLKRWPVFNFVQLTQRIAAEFHLKIVFAGGPTDKAACDAIAQQAGVASVVLAGATSLGESLALYKRAKVLVSADSGPLHLANGVGADVIGIFGPTRVEITGPRGSGRSQILFKDAGCNQAPCYHLSCTNNVCMQAITVDDVVNALKRIIN